MKASKNILSLSLLSLALSTLLVGCVLDDGPVRETRAEVSGRPYFDLFRAESGRYHFNLTGGNHEVMMSSQSYGTRTAALGGVLSVLDNAGEPANYDLRQAKNGQWYFNLEAANGKVIATSETYASKSNAKRAVEQVNEAVGDYLAFMAVRTGARFEVFEGENGDYYFNLHAANGAIVLHSQGYSSHAAALNGTFSVADNGVEPAAYDVREAANGGYYFNVIASNGQVVGTSEVYASKSNAERARDAVVALLPEVELL